MRANGKRLRQEQVDGDIEVYVPAGLVACVVILCSRRSPQHACRDETLLVE